MSTAATAADVVTVIGYGADDRPPELATIVAEPGPSPITRPASFTLTTVAGEGT